jgi:sugar phosphate isomerase/epimerase
VSCALALALQSSRHVEAITDHIFCGSTVMRERNECGCSSKRLRLTRRRFTAGIAAAIATTASLTLHGETVKRRNSFVAGMTCYTPIRFDLAQCLEQLKETPLRKIELPVWALVNPKALIPEFMVDAHLGGQWQYSIPDLRQLLKTGGFQVECVCIVGFLAGYPGSEPIIRRRIDFAERFGAKLINLAFCSLSPPDNVEKYRKSACSMLRSVGRYAADRGVRIAVETWGGITQDADEAIRTLDAVGLDNVGITFDTGNFLLANPKMDAASLPGELRRLAKHIFYVQLKDVVRKGGSQPITTILGQGEVDFRSVFAILHDAGFYGPLAFDVETTHACQSGDIRESQKDMLASIAYLRSIGEFDQ